MARRRPPRKVTWFEPVPPRLACNTIIESTFEVGRRFRCMLRVDCGQLAPGAVIRPMPGEWHPRMPKPSTTRSLPTGAPAATRKPRPRVGSQSHSVHDGKKSANLTGPVRACWWCADTSPFFVT